MDPFPGSLHARNLVGKAHLCMVTWDLGPGLKVRIERFVDRHWEVLGLRCEDLLVLDERLLVQHPTETSTFYPLPLL